MKRFLPVLVFLLLVTEGFAQKSVTNLFSLQNNLTNIQKSQLEKQVTEALVLQPDVQVLKQIFSENNSGLTLSLPLKKNLNITLDLIKFNVTTPDTKIIARTASGNQEVSLKENDLVVSYSGRINGFDKSFVFITIFNDQLSGYMMTGTDTYTIGTLNDKDINSAYVIFQESKRLVGNKFSCGTKDTELPQSIRNEMEKIKKDGTGERLSTTLLKADIAVDIDFFSYQTYGNSIPTATAWGLAHMAGVSAIYLHDENVQMTVPFLRVWTVADPYSSTASGDQMLNLLRSEWLNNMGSVSRTTVHLISRRQNLDVAGIAYLNALCSTNIGYGLAATLNGGTNLLPAYSYNIEVSAHELGHNFGSPHTHSCSWAGGPIDTCAPIEDGNCYNGPTHQTIGTIMSYCDVFVAGAVVMTFGPQPGALIRAHAESSGCIVPAAKQLILGLPNGGELYRTGNTASVWWGAGITTNINVELSTNNGSSWTSLGTNIPAQNRTLNYTIPNIAGTSQARVRIYEIGNPSNADTSDAPFTIKLTLNSMTNTFPPNFTQINTNINNPAPYTFSWTSAGTNASIRYAWKLRKSGFADRKFESNNSGTDSNFSIRRSQLDSAASNFGGGDSLLCTWTAWAYSDTDSLQGTTSLVIIKRNSTGITNISSSIPDKFDLGYNYPNPFNPVTNFKFDLPKNSEVSIKIYDSQGKEVAELINTKLDAGSYTYQWNAQTASSGIYFYRMKAGEFTSTKRMVLIK
ncbi:hypothetical protein BH10BAC5_BH10BAC5_09430 [soil metagenome]